MRLENHDLEVLLPLGIQLLCQKSRINIQRLSYKLEKERMYLKADGNYSGLTVGIELLLHFFVKGGALGIDIEQGYLDSAFMKGEILPFLKNMLKNQPYFCIDEKTLYFYHPKMNIQHFSINEGGIELTFK